MCTVSYIPGKNKGNFTLTSNRDETAYRQTFAPKVYEVNNQELCFPKDALAGGSWISMNNRGRVVCLLNGAFVPHKKNSFYKQSRGIILIELAEYNKNPEQYFEEKNLDRVEPFTIITVEKKENKIKHLSEFIWDGNKKHIAHLNPKESKIWSSVTLYSNEHRQLRNQWFSQFLQEKNGSISAESIIGFHSGNHIDDNSINVIMKREGGLKTVSITQVTTNKSSFNMKYFDLHSAVETEVEL